MAIGWTQGTPCDLMREHIGLNNSSFSATPQESWPDEAFIQAEPFKTNHTSDQTAYATQPTATSWQHQLRLRPVTGGALT